VIQLADVYSGVEGTKEGNDMQAKQPSDKGKVHVQSNWKKQMVHQTASGQARCLKHEATGSITTPLWKGC